MMVMYRQCIHLLQQQIRLLREIIESNEASIALMEQLLYLQDQWLLHFYIKNLVFYNYSFIIAEFLPRGLISQYGETETALRERKFYDSETNSLEPSYPFSQQSQSDQ